MTYYETEWDPYDYIPPYDPFDKVCKYCGKNKLRWRVIGKDRYRLFDAKGNIHDCKEVKIGKEN